MHLSTTQDQADWSPSWERTRERELQRQREQRQRDWEQQRLAMEREQSQWCRKLRVEVHDTREQVRAANRAGVEPDLSALEDVLDETCSELDRTPDWKINNPRGLVDEYRALRKRITIPNRGHHGRSGRYGGGERAAHTMRPSVLQQEDDLIRTQPTPQRTDHESRETGVAESERRDAPIHDRHRNGELVVLDGYRNKAVNGGLECIDSVMGGRGIWSVHPSPRSLKEFILIQTNRCKTKRALSKNCIDEDTAHLLARLVQAGRAMEKPALAELVRTLEATPAQPG